MPAYDSAKNITLAEIINVLAKDSIGFSMYLLVFSTDSSSLKSFLIPRYQGNSQPRGAHAPVILRPFYTPVGRRRMRLSEAHLRDYRHQ